MPKGGQLNHVNQKRQHILMDELNGPKYEELESFRDFSGIFNGMRCSILGTNHVVA